MERLLLRHQRAPGDIIVMTALVRDLAIAYPNKYHIAVDTSFKEIWDNNPYIKPMPDKKGAKIVNLTYGEYIRKASSEKIHFLTAFYKNLKTQTGIEVPMLYPHPDLHLSPEEQKPLMDGRYWVVVAGGKGDFTTKHWVYERYQKVVDILAEIGIPVVQIGGKGQHPTHFHPELKNVTSLVGKTDLRQMFRVINNAEGVICTITSAMHIAAALGKPCVVTGGGREEWWWEAYNKDNPGLDPVRNLLPVSHQYLHTIGKLDCCATKGCWKNKVQKMEGDKSFCHYAVPVESGQMVPLCMDMISVERVVSSVLSYYIDGTLPLLEGMVLPDITQRLTLDKNGEKYSLFMIKESEDTRVSQKILEMPQEKPEIAKKLAGLQPVAPNVASKPVPPRLTEDLNKKKTISVTATVDMTPAAKENTPAPATRLIDSETLGGKITLFLLLYGNYTSMHTRCLSAIQNTTSRNDLDLRVYCNNVGPDTDALCQKMLNAGVISSMYRSETNKFKYPCMREMFHDPNNPIKTKWSVWFDDDTMCDVDPLWFSKLCSAINGNAIADSDFGMLGPIYHFSMQPKHATWFKSADWYRGRYFRDKLGKPTVNGSRVFFVTGSCWAIKTEAIHKANIPDVRLSHNGGDICIGEQMWQNGYTLKNWNGDKRIICWSSTARRGASQPLFNI
jgi:ADP-heptose:LPS heptosyltransferase